jgi:hypothetical protein
VISSRSSNSRNSCFRAPEHLPVITLGWKPCKINVPSAVAPLDRAV